MKLYWTADPARYSRMTTEELRNTFLPQLLYMPGETRLAYLELDRAVVGMSVPTEKELALPQEPLLRADSFLNRREMGVLNIGDSGAVTADGVTYALDNLDCLYLGRGAASVSFRSKDAGAPAVFYLLSYPAHQTYPSQLVRQRDAAPMELGSAEKSNRRSVIKYIHEGGAQSCQLVMGVTHLAQGSVWNTMPPHTHARRSEIYIYFNLAVDDRVFHLMGTPEETRHFVLSNRDVVASPGWSIHAGAGTSAYSFCWGMGGENRDYTDMDVVAPEALR